LLACTDGSSLLWLTAGLGGGENARRLLFLKEEKKNFCFSYSHTFARFIYEEHNLFDSKSKAVEHP